MARLSCVLAPPEGISPEQVAFIGQLPGIVSLTYYDKEVDDDGAGFDEGNI